jgi:predicted metal-dependent hydrolase
VRRLKRRSAATPSLDELELMARLRRDAAFLASHFNLSYREIAPEKPRVKRRYGACTAEGKIALRLRHAKTGEPLKYSSLVNTLCHELAHLRHFNHGPRFKALYLQILEFARSSEIYRPGPPRGAVAVQLELFQAADTLRQSR